MCENPDIVSRTSIQRLEHKLLIETQKQNRLEVDNENAYFMGKAIPKERWRLQALGLSLPADIYLDIAALAKEGAGSHVVKYYGNSYIVDVNGIVHSGYGQHREIVSIKIH